jgi:hypothetical protein
MTGAAILICGDPHADYWELGDLAASDGQIHILGWRGFPTVDAGPPDAVLDIICKSLVTNAEVTFLSSDLPIDDPEVVGTVRPSGFLSRLRGRHLSVVTTRQAHKVRAAFGDSGAPWTLKGQVLLGSQPGDPPTGLDAGHLADLLGNRWYDRIDDLLWIFRPGVDGDVAGIRAGSVQTLRTLFSTMSQLCSEAGIAWLAVGEDDFRDQLAS